MMFDSFEAYDVQATRRVSKAEGKAEGKAEAILELLAELGEIPSTLRQTILNEKDLNQLKIWLKLAAKAENLNEFKKNAGLG